MKREIRKQIRWNQHEIDLINAVRGYQDFSDFVRQNAVNAANRIKMELKQNGDYV